ncbi:IS3 family transposase [Blastochloris sulfoviridis]|uniref:IS3 family transposase n=1 Tax=Blastochloris sulfoviridis TaxID=50712 RepID=A0A5M6HQW3_9HYPH|nr:IS3 family transposase [Blastochloris sulfoviridis]
MFPLKNCVLQHLGAICDFTYAQAAASIHDPERPYSKQTDGDACRGARCRRLSRARARGERTAGVRDHRADRSTVHYRHRRPDDAALRTRLRELAAERHRFGYRRLRILLRREGKVVNRKKIQRLYREEGLSVRRRRGRKRAIGLPASGPGPDGGERPLVLGLRPRPARQRPPVPHPEHHRRRHQGMPRARPANRCRTATAGRSSC